MVPLLLLVKISAQHPPRLSFLPHAHSVSSSLSLPLAETHSCSFSCHIPPSLSHTQTDRHTNIPSHFASICISFRVPFLIYHFPSPCSGSSSHSAFLPRVLSHCVSLPLFLFSLLSHTPLFLYLPFSMGFKGIAACHCDCCLTGFQSITLSFRLPPLVPLGSRHLTL